MLSTEQVSPLQIIRALFAVMEPPGPVASVIVATTFVPRQTGILFMPGWLRMADLALHVWARPLARLTGLCVKPFAYLSRRFAALRRHGYLIAAVGERPEAASGGRPTSVES